MAKKDLKSGTKSGSKSRRALFSGGGLEEATKRSYDMKDSGGFGPKYLKAGVKAHFWFPKDGNHLIDVIPYLAGDNDPNCASGKPQYVLDIWVHQKVGVLQQAFVCPAKNHKKRCPICEKQMEMRKSGDYSDDEIKEMNPKRRTIYNVICHDSREEIKKGVMLFETAHFFFENHVAEISQRPKTGGYIPFSHPDEGRSIAFKIVKKGQNTEWLGHRFEDRDEPIDDDILESALVLDELIHIPTLAELKQAVVDGFSDTDDDEDDDEKPRKKSKPSKNRKEEADEDEEENDDYDSDDDEDDEDDEDEKPVKKSSKKSPKKSSRDEEDDDEDDDEIPDDEDDDEDDEKPAKKSGKASSKKKSKEDEEDDDDDDDDEYGEDDDDDDEEEEKPRKKKPSSSKNSKPAKKRK